jgi:hypothetical protein
VVAAELGDRDHVEVLRRALLRERQVVEAVLGLGPVRGGLHEAEDGVDACEWREAVGGVGLDERVEVVAKLAALAARVAPLPEGADPLERAARSGRVGERGDRIEDGLRPLARERGEGEGEEQAAAEEDPTLTRPLVVSY